MSFRSPLAVNQPIYYRVRVTPLNYETAYKLHRGTPETSPIHCIVPPHPEQPRVKLVAISDTHGRAEVVSAHARRIEANQPDVLVWNGDVCNHIDNDTDLTELVLRAGKRIDGKATVGWATERPLIYVPGNHDVRGLRARELPDYFIPGPDAALPYNTAQRIGPLAIITLDTGEDKPDDHESFGDTAAYEPYRRAQAAWLREQIQRPEIANAPFKIAFAHIPLIGEPGDNDGQSYEGHARYSGEGARLWGKHLLDVGVQAILSGHTHDARLDPPTDELPVAQVVGGGPQLDYTSLTIVEVDADSMNIRIQNPDGETIEQYRWPSR